MDSVGFPRVSSAPFPLKEMTRPAGAAGNGKGSREVIEQTKPMPGHFAQGNGNPLENVDVMLAPLCGITDSIFRRICLRAGADMVVTEMISSEGLVRNSDQIRAIRGLDMAEGPIALQLFGGDPVVMGEAAAILSELRPRFIDMNFGCPVRKIVSKNGGSAVLKDIDLLSRICERVVAASRVPVSAKIRSGWDKPTSGYVREIGLAIAGAGVSVIAIHARTRRQAFKGKANWDLIAELKSAVSIPVVGNGDVTDPPSYFEIRERTGCDAVMLGRGAIGNPWVFEEIKAAKEGRPYAPPTPGERVRVALDHVGCAVAELGEPTGVVVSRKIMAAYLKRLPGARELRGKIMHCETLGELEAVFSRYLDALPTELDRSGAGGPALQ